MPCRKCGDHTDNIYMVNYISLFAVVCHKCYNEITKKG